MDGTAQISGGLPGRMFDALVLGGPAMWAIAALSVISLAVIIWKIWDLLAAGAWSGGAHSQAAIAAWAAGDPDGAQAAVAGRRSLRAQLVRAAMASLRDPQLDRAGAEAETGRVARDLLARARSGLRALELAVVIGPLLGLLGTVAGMIAAFRALQEAGVQADPATLAGGIWEALLTTAAGMAVAIPAQIALSGFDAVVDRLRHDMEDAATRIFARAPATLSERPRAAAE
ncbi:MULTISPECIES: MotA/TolQ/ExbB proton channel family protein [unclassified Thioclava]|nr:MULTISPECIES: MotA/TolQ/ExbB proton channel family protein [unclassified Thioclava]OWY05545.1 flagellar motor protein MotA [Thioclava sp. F1Mire-8]OWY07234.1 flagellar motor protein MotA [Thioclava sp. IC9]OWY12815.1 flagellar motor protein MotA [Thioclava sp. F34-6]PWE49891.1 MotA/TolQ/ExbB proton channel family protein [Thioclava sp. NG1]